LFKGVSFAVDGLGLAPREYATLLEQLTRSQDVHADDYSNGGFVEELEGTFARLLGKERAIFLPTGTLTNHLAARALASAQHRVPPRSLDLLGERCGGLGGVLDRAAPCASSRRFRRGRRICFCFNAAALAD
jgi:hypothetical protein